MTLTRRSASARGFRRRGLALREGRDEGLGVVRRRRRRRALLPDTPRRLREGHPLLALHPLDAGHDLPRTQEAHVLVGHDRLDAEADVRTRPKEVRHALQVGCRVRCDRGAAGLEGGGIDPQLFDPPVSTDDRADGPQRRRHEPAQDVAQGAPQRVAQAELR